MKKGLSAVQVDFLLELMNIAGGNAATALSQLFGRAVEVEVPDVYIGPVKGAAAILGKYSFRAACVKMEMMGDVRGRIFMFVPEKDEERIAHFTGETRQGNPASGQRRDHSIMEEIANIPCSAALIAIHDFCGLKIFNSVPAMVYGMVPAILDEYVAQAAREGGEIMLVEIRTEFEIEKEGIVLFMIMLPSEESVTRLADALIEAKKRYGINPGSSGHREGI